MLCLENKKILLFDLDGTMADTERLHWTAYGALLKDYGICLTASHIQKYIGHSEKAIYDMITEDFGIEFDYDGFAENRLKKYLLLVRETNLRPYAWIEEIVRNFDGVMGIVSSQMPHVVEALLKFWDFEKYFPKGTVFCCHDGRYTKKGIYENVFSYFGIEPCAMENVVLFEDSRHYINEAKNLGMTVVGVEHTYNKGILKNCDTIYKPLFEDAKKA